MDDKAVLKEAHRVMLVRIVDESGDSNELFAHAVQTLAGETSLHAIIEALFQIAQTRMWTGETGEQAAFRELGQALELTMNIAERRML